LLRAIKVRAVKVGKGVGVGDSVRENKHPTLLETGCSHGHITPLPCLFSSVIFSW
jgi:hypothetical protein